MAGQRAAAHRNNLRQRIEGMRFGNVLLKIVDQTVNSRIAGISGHRLGDVLRLTSLAMRRDDHPSGYLVRHRTAKTLANNIQTAIQRRRSTC
ncbi:hypothetical protein D3C75_1004910 [compost metagenome]